MKITSSGIERYQSVMQGVKAGEGEPRAKNGAKTLPRADKVTLSGDGAARAERGRLTAALADEVEASASPERLGQLRAAVQDGSYHVSSEEIADAILDMKA